MSTYCYLCLGQGRGPNDTYFVCKNCGGAYCNQHGGRNAIAKASWCVDCVPNLTSGLLGAAAGGIRLIHANPALADSKDRLLRDVVSSRFDGDLDQLANFLERLAEQSAGE